MARITRFHRVGQGSIPCMGVKLKKFIKKLYYYNNISYCSNTYSSSE